MSFNIIKITRNNRDIILYVKDDLFNGLAEMLTDSIIDVAIYDQPKRSKREDFVECNCKLLDRAIKRAHSEGAWDQDDYDAMYALVKEAKMRCSEHDSNAVREVQ